MGLPFAEVIGDPIAHSKSPAIHNHWLEQLGMNGDYRATRVAATGLGEYFRTRRTDQDWRGCNVAMPLKIAAMKQVDELDLPTRRIGALNCVTSVEGKLVGANTDWQAIRVLLDSAGAKPGKVAIIGTGGAARAALEEMRQSKVEHVRLISRDPGRARALLADFELAGDAATLAAPFDADLLINASPLGMTGYQAPAIDLSQLRADAIVFDMVYAPAETLLLRSAREQGIRTIDGLTMLIHQAALAFSLFFGRRPDPAHSAELRGRLTS